MNKLMADIKNEYKKWTIENSKEWDNHSLLTLDKETLLYTLWSDLNHSLENIYNITSEYHNVTKTDNEIDLCMSDAFDYHIFEYSVNGYLDEYKLGE